MSPQQRWIDRDRNFNYQLPLIFVAINEISTPQSCGGTRVSKWVGRATSATPALLNLHHEAKNRLARQASPAPSKRRGIVRLQFLLSPSRTGDPGIDVSG